VHRAPSWLVCATASDFTIVPATGPLPGWFEPVCKRIAYRLFYALLSQPMPLGILMQFDGRRHAELLPYR
jgi:hypothetical protein